MHRKFLEGLWAEVSGDLENKHSLIIEEAEAPLLNKALFLQTGCLQ